MEDIHPKANNLKVKWQTLDFEEFAYVLAFNIGDRVRYKNKIGKDEGFVTGIMIRQARIAYFITWSDKEEKPHYDFELELIENG